MTRIKYKKISKYEYIASNIVVNGDIVNVILNTQYNSYTIEGKKTRVFGNSSSQRKTKIVIRAILKQLGCYLNDEIKKFKKKTQ